MHLPSAATGLNPPPLAEDPLETGRRRANPFELAVAPRQTPLLAMLAWPATVAEALPVWYARALETWYGPTIFPPGDAPVRINWVVVDAESGDPLAWGAY